MKSLRPRPLPPRYARSPFPASRGRISVAPFPFLNRPESGQLRYGQTRRRCPGPGRARPGLFLPGARGSLSLRRATSSACRSAPARRPPWSGRRTPSPIRGSTTGSRTSRKNSICRRLSPNCAISSTGSRTIPSASRGMVLRMCLRMGEHLGAERERVGVRLAGPPPQRMTAARARVLALLADGMVRGKSEAAREAGVSVGVIDGLIDEGTPRNLGAAAGAGGGKARSGFSRTDFTADQSAAAAALKATRRRRRLFRDAARRRHRLGQDRSLFRGGRRHDPPRPPEPHPDAGDRAHRAVSRPLRRALRRAPGGMAFGTVAAQTRAHVARRRRRRSRRRRRRAVGVVPALCRSRADRRR